MSPVLLGIALGVLNVIANAVLFGTVGPEPRGAMMVLVYGMAPGFGAGAVLGALAGATAKQPRVSRYIALGTPCVLVVLCLGAAFGLTDFVPTALIPTLLCCVVLEVRTRKDPNTVEDVTDALAPPPRSAVRLAMLCGAVVMLIVMIGVGSMATQPGWHGLVDAYFPWGLALSLALSAPFGVIADHMRGVRVWRRRAVLLTCALGLTALLITLLRLDGMIAITFIPVAAGCLALERYSRPPPVMPVAVLR